MRYEVLILLCIAVVWLSWQYRRDRAQARRRRHAFFSDCEGLLASARLTQRDVHYAVLSGQYEGFEVKLEPFIDDLTVRKLPSLWLKVSLIAPVRYSGTFDLLARPRGTEFYSPAFDLPLEIKLPSDWPLDAAARCDDPDNIPPTEAIASHLHLFHDERFKELLIAPAGVRLVYQIDQAERSHYAVLRRSEFDIGRLSPDLAYWLLDAASSLYRSVAASPRLEHSLTAIS